MIRRRPLSHPSPASFDSTYPPRPPRFRPASLRIVSLASYSLPSSPTTSAAIRFFFTSLPAHDNSFEHRVSRQPSTRTSSVSPASASPRTPIDRHPRPVHTGILSATKIPDQVPSHLPDRPPTGGNRPRCRASQIPSGPVTMLQVRSFALCPLRHTPMPILTSPSRPRCPLREATAGRQGEPPSPHHCSHARRSRGGLQ